MLPRNVEQALRYRTTLLVRPAGPGTWAGMSPP